MKRIESVDLFRVIAIIAVIAIHTATHHGPFSVVGGMNARMLLHQAERFAVPFFFMISGYFWASKCTERSDFWPRSVAMSKRALIIFLAWSIVYFAAKSVFIARKYGAIDTLKLTYWGILGAHPNLETLNLLFVGSKDHLWFLPALACAALISGALLAIDRPRLLLTLAVALFVVGLAGDAYANTPVGFHVSFNFRNGPFFSLISFVTGYILQRRPKGIPSVSAGVALAAFGLALQIVEVAWLRRLWGTYLSQDYTIGTYFFGVGVTILALSNKEAFRISAISALGPLVLGIYASHVLFLDALRPLNNRWQGFVIWDVGYVLIVFAISLLVTRALYRFKATRLFVS